MARDQERKLWDMIEDIEVCMLVTEDQGVLRSRPMWGQQKEFAGELWFFTHASAHKTLEVQQNQRVNLSYAEPKDQNYVSVSGTAELVRDKARFEEFWQETLTTWFPKGLDDPDLAMLKVTVEQAEYWDAPSSTMIHAYGYVKAKLTGHAPQAGDNEKVNVRRA
jgi:general stress protein 26